MKKFIDLIIASLLVLTACNKVVEEQVPNLMTFSFQFPGATKATETSFEVGDNVGLFGVSYEGEKQLPLQISGNWINNEKITFDGARWTSAHNLVWPENNIIDLYAYYPYSKTLESIESQKFTVELDQSVPKSGNELSGYEKSDLLWTSVMAAEKESDTPAPINLQFKHICSKVIVKLQKGEFYEGSLPDDASLKIMNTVPVGVFNLQTGSVSRNIFETEGDIICKKVLPSDTDELPYFEAIVIPQRSSTRRPLFELCAGKTSYLVEDVFNFKPGKAYVYNLVLNSSPDQIIINIGGHVDGWD